MLAIGLDIGTGNVKCVSDNKKIKFPSLYAYRLPDVWENGNAVIEGIGDAAVEISKHPDAVVIRPVMQGRPVDDKGFLALIKEAVRLATVDSASHDDLSNISIAVGLPYDAKDAKNIIQSMIQKSFKTRNCRVVPQVYGTLIESNLDSALVVSLGQGTTELVAYRNKKIEKGKSIHHGIGYITTKLTNDKLAYLDVDIFERKSSDTKRIVSLLSDEIADEIKEIRISIGNDYPTILSGGGVFVPGLKDAILEKIKSEVIIPQDPIYSNAIGLHTYAAGDLIVK